MAEEKGKPNGQGSPADDVGAVIARFERAGVDLRQADPVRIAKAMALLERVGPNGRVYTAEDLPVQMDRYLAQMVSDPQGNAYLRQALGAGNSRPTPRPDDQADVDPDDPTARRLAALEQHLQQYGQHLQRLYEDRNALMRERSTDERLREVYGHLDTAVQKIAGAGPYKDYLRKALNREFIGGVFSDELLTPHGINAWTQQELEQLQAVRAAEAETAQPDSIPVGQGGGVSFSDDEAPASVDAWQEKWESILPE